MKKLIITSLLLMQFGLGFSQDTITNPDLKSAIEKAQQSSESISEAFGPYTFGMSLKDFKKATKLAIKNKSATRNSIGNLEFLMYFNDGRPYNLILANAAFYQNKLCGLDFVYEKFDAVMSDIIMQEILQADRLKEMEKYIKTDGFIFIKNNLQIDLSHGSMSYVNAPIVSKKAKENIEKNNDSRKSF